MRYLALIVTAVFSLNITANSLDGVLAEASSLYDVGEYQRAINLYEELLITNDSGNIHHNLGNSFFRLGKLGPAIYHFRVAEKFLGRDGDVKYNLNYARKKALDKIDSSAFERFKIFPINKFEAILLIMVFYFFFWCANILRHFFKNEYLKWVRNLSLIVLLPLSAHYLRLAFFTSDFGVVIASESKVYSGPGKDNIVLFTLHEGAEFDFKNVAQKSWSQISLSDGKKGWIKSSAILLN